jgi:hypothetical protein
MGWYSSRPMTSLWFRPFPLSLGRLYLLRVQRGKTKIEVKDGGESGPSVGANKNR